MGLAMEILTGRVTNAGATPTAVTMASGDSLSIRSASFESGIFLENLWATGATAGITSVRSPRMHDNVQGIRFVARAADGTPMLPDEVAERLYPQDQLAVLLSGGGAETDLVNLMVYYNDLPGATARLYGWEDIQPRIEHYLTAEVAPTSSATIGEYGAGVTVTSSFDLLKANTDYAILGYQTSVAVAAVGIRSPDFGNLRVGGPGSLSRVDTRNWFIDQSKMSGRPHIPVFNSANKGSTLVDTANNAASTAAFIDLILAQLRG